MASYWGLFKPCPCGSSLIRAEVNEIARCAECARPTELDDLMATTEAFDRSSRAAMQAFDALAKACEALRQIAAAIIASKQVFVKGEPREPTPAESWKDRPSML